MNTPPRDHRVPAWPSLLIIATLAIALTGVIGWALAGPYLGLYFAGSLALILIGFAINCALSWWWLRNRK